MEGPVLDYDDRESIVVTRKIGIQENTWLTTRIGEYRFPFAVAIFSLRSLMLFLSSSLIRPRSRRWYPHGVVLHRSDISTVPLAKDVDLVYLLLRVNLCTPTPPRHTPFYPSSKTLRRHLSGVSSRGTPSLRIDNARLLMTQTAWWITESGVTACYDIGDYGRHRW
jgi:hypothetical protein